MKSRAADDRHLHPEESDRKRKSRHSTQAGNGSIRTSPGSPRF
jgi:hypothetical protein